MTKQFPTESHCLEGAVHTKVPGCLSARGQLFRGLAEIVVQRPLPSILVLLPIPAQWCSSKFYALPDDLEHDIHLPPQ